MFKWLKGQTFKTDRAEATEASVPTAALAVETTHTDITEIVDKGMQLFHAREYAAARGAFQRALALDPTNLIALYQTVSIHLSLAELGEAKAASHHALDIWPDHPELLLLRAYVAKRSADNATSLTILQRLQTLHPEYPDLDMKIAEEFATLGRGDEAVAAFDRAIASNPEELSRKSIRLFYLNYFGLLPRDQLFEEHKKWGDMIDNGFAPLRKILKVDQSPDRPLRIGLVSGDLRTHAVALFLEGYLRQHDRASYPIQCFDVSPHPEDAVTAQLRGLVEQWHRVAATSDDQLADEIRNQKIDVLVDLSGHTMFNRLLVFARRPAPVQVSWFGYMNTTGLASIDYRLTDPEHDPVGESEHLYTEKLFYIPSLACFSPPAISPDVSAAPFLETGKVTFLSANQWTKVTESVVSVWAEILRDESRPKLRICAKSAGSADFRKSVTDQFEQLGVLAEQIEIQPFLPMADFLATYSDVDIALDPFPYGGGTTTLHTIWMGVPIISLEGDTELGRATPAMLRGFGLPDFVAQTRDEYRDKAIALARDPSPLVDIRASLRQRMAESAALDAKGLAHNVEKAFRTMWHSYCAANPKSPRTDASAK